MARTRHIAAMLELHSNYRRHTDIYEGVQRFAKERGWKLTIDEFADHTMEKWGPREARYDGIISRATINLAEKAKRRKVPLVNVWLNSPVRDQLPGAFCDFAEVGRQTAKHLLARGLCRFAALTCNTSADEVVWQAFAETIAKSGYSCTNIRIPLAPAGSVKAWEKTLQMMKASLDTWHFPIGVWALGEHHGRLLAQTCEHHGARVPEDVAIIAGNNEATFCLAEPSLTSVELGHVRVGYEAARLLEQEMNRADRAKAGSKTREQKKKRKPAAGPKHVVLPPEGLVLRASTDFFAVEDKLVAAALEFIGANSHRPINVDDVARSVATEPRTLQRRFGKHLDRPIAAEIRRVRLERVKRELVQSQDSITEIGRAAGFDSPTSMYSAFRREFGMSPKEYRSQFRFEDS